MKDLGSIAGLYEVTGQSGYPRNVVKLEQIMEAPSAENTRTLVQSSRDEALIERFSGLESAVTCHGCRISESYCAFPPAEVSLEHDAALPVSSQSAPPCARVLNVDGFSWASRFCH